MGLNTGRRSSVFCPHIKWPDQAALIRPIRCLPVQAGPCARHCRIWNIHQCPAGHRQPTHSLSAIPLHISGCVIAVPQTIIYPSVFPVHADPDTCVLGHPDRYGKISVAPRVRITSSGTSTQKSASSVLGTRQANTLQLHQPITATAYTTRPAIGIRSISAAQTPVGPGNGRPR